MTNTKIVRGFIEAINNNDFDRIWDFCSKDCVGHVAPYVGLGIIADDRDGQHVIITETAPGAPADGVILPGDELVKVTSGAHTWATFPELKSGMWGQGVPGTPLTVTVKRDARLLDLELLRGHVRAWDQKLTDFADYWHDNKLKVWPDLKTDIQLIFEQGEFVGFYAIDSGTNLEYHRAATYAECSIFRVRDGKITDMWGVEDGFSELKQLGYEIREPQPEATLQP